jgi:RHS repeat-associated protein
VVDRSRYEAYGANVNIAGSTNPVGIGFTGHVNDVDTGLVYMQQRYYDPVAGRFLSTDQVLTDTSSGATFNRYDYGNNNPYKYTDPDGRFGVIGGLIGASIEIGLQVAIEGRVTNWTAVGVAGAVGVVTGGLGGIIGKAAASGTVTVGKAVTAIAAVGGGASATGKVAEGALTGKAATSSEVAVAATGGAIGGAVGAKIDLSVIANVEKMAASGGVAGHMGTTTQSAMQQGGKVVEPATTAGQQAGQRAADTASAYIEKQINK